MHRCMHFGWRFMTHACIIGCKCMHFRNIGVYFWKKKCIFGCMHFLANACNCRIFACSFWKKVHALMHALRMMPDEGSVHYSKEMHAIWKYWRVVWEKKCMHWRMQLGWRLLTEACVSRRKCKRWRCATWLLTAVEKEGRNRSLQ